MDSIAGTKSSLSWAVNLSVIALVLLWIFPTLGLFVSSFRTSDQITSSGWWAALFPSEQVVQLRAENPEETRVETSPGVFVVEGNLFADGSAPEFSSWGTSSRDIAANAPGDTADLGDGESFTLNPDGSFVWQGDADQISGRGQRVFATATTPPEFTLDNYRQVLLDPRNAEGMTKAFFNTLTVVIPATIIPILIAAFAAYALAWMEFPGRALLTAAVVGLLVVPLQLALIPLLSFHNAIGIGKGYLGVWLAHTGFGMPLAIYLLAELHGRSAARHHRERQGRRGDGFPDLHQDRAAAVVPGAREFRDLPVPVDVERSSGGAGVPDRRQRRDDGDDEADRGASRHAGRRLGDPRRPPPSFRSRCRSSCSSRFSAILCAAFWPARSSRIRYAHGLRDALPSGRADGRRSRLVAGGGHLSDLSALVPGFERRRHRRSGRDHPPAALRGEPRGGCDLDLAVLRVTDEGFRIRRVGLSRHRADVRDDVGFRRADRTRASAGPAGDDRPRAVAHVGSAPVVPREPVEPGQSEGELVRLGGRQTGRLAAEQLAVDLRRLGLGMGRGADAVLSAQLPDRTAGPQFPRRRGAGRASGRGAVLAGTRRGRIPLRHREFLRP